MIHELKTIPEYFEAVIKGEKLFEVRKNDRPFKKGDILALNEFQNGYYTGRSCLVYVDYILREKEFCKLGFVIMSIKPCLIRKVETPYNPAELRASYNVPLSTDADE